MAENALRSVTVNQKSKWAAGQLNNDLKLTIKLCEVEEELQIRVMILSTFIAMKLSPRCIQPKCKQTHKRTLRKSNPKLLTLKKTEDQGMLEPQYTPLHTRL